MLGTAFDFTGAAALVAAFTGLLTAVLAILNRGKTNTISDATTDIHAAVQTRNGKSLGQIADKLNDVVDAGAPGPNPEPGVASTP